MSDNREFHSPSNRKSPPLQSSTNSKQEKPTAKKTDTAAQLTSSPSQNGITATTTTENTPLVQNNVNVTSQGASRIGGLQGVPRHAAAAASNHNATSHGTTLLHAPVGTTATSTPPVSVNMSTHQQAARRGGLGVSNHTATTARRTPNGIMTDQNALAWEIVRQEVLMNQRTQQTIQQTLDESQQKLLASQQTASNGMYRVLDRIAPPNGIMADQNALAREIARQEVLLNQGTRQSIQQTLGGSQQKLLASQQTASNGMYRVLDRIASPPGVPPPQVAPVPVAHVQVPPPPVAISMAQPVQDPTRRTSTAPVAPDLVRSTGAHVPVQGLLGGLLGDSDSSDSDSHDIDSDDSDESIPIEPPKRRRHIRDDDDDDEEEEDKKMPSAKHSRTH